MTFFTFIHKRSSNMNYFIYFTSSKVIVFGNLSWQESESKPITDYLDSYSILFVLFLFLFFSRNSPCRERFLNSAKAHQSTYSELTRLTLFKTQDPENHILFSGTYPFRTNEGYHLRAANKIQLTIIPRPRPHVSRYFSFRIQKCPRPHARIRIAIEFARPHVSDTYLLSEKAS